MSVHQDYLWGNPAFFCALLLGQAFQIHGWNQRPGAFLRIDGLPLHVYREAGESVIKPCAEVLLNERDAEFLMEQGIMPLASLKDQDAATLVRFQSIADPLEALSGPWSSPRNCARRASLGFDDGMEPLGHGAIRFRHLGNLREHVTETKGTVEKVKALLNKGTRGINSFMAGGKRTN